MDDLLRVMADGSRVQYRGSQFFVYTPQPLVAELSDATPSVTLQVPIQSDADFELMELTHVTDDDAGAVVESPLATFQIQQSGSGIDFLVQPVPIGAMIGTAQLPFLLPRTRIWSANSQMLLTLTRYAPNGISYNIRLAFIGQKLFR